MCIRDSHHAEPSLGGHPEVTGVRVGVQHPGPAWPREEEVHVPPGRQVAVGLAAGGDHPGERVAVEPLADDDVLGAVDDMGDVDLRITVVAVSYTHLDVYKRQVPDLSGADVLPGRGT